MLDTEATVEAAVRRLFESDLPALPRDHMNTEHVQVGSDFSDAHVAEIFLHHRVLIIPVLDDVLVSGGSPATTSFEPSPSGS